MQTETRNFYAWYVVLILTIAYTISYIDRQIFNLLVGPIRADLDISDTQVSLLQGFAFAIFYSVMGVPIARIADRGNRRNVIAAGIFVWCLMTAACGFARNFLQLFLARVGVGVGEAALSPPAYSIIADYFPEERRALATGTYSLGVYAGAGLAMLVGGAVIELISLHAPIDLPLLSALKPWQLTFIVVGLPGVLVGLLMFTIKEPVRRGSIGQEATVEKASTRDIIDFMKAERRELAAIFVGISFVGIVIIGILSWTPSYFIRLHGWSISSVGINYGWILLLFGTTGAVAGGWFSDFLHARGASKAPLRAMILVSLASLPFAVAMPLVSDDRVALLLLIPATFFLSSPVGLSAAAIQNLTPAKMAAQVTAIYMLVVAFVGTGFGPMAVALCTDYIFGYDNAVGYSLALTAAVLTPLGILSLYLGLPPSTVKIGSAAIEQEQGNVSDI